MQTAFPFTRRSTLLAALGALACGAASAQAPVEGVIRHYVKGRTFDMHTHIYADEWWSEPATPGERGGGARLGGAPYFAAAARARAAARATLPPEERAAIEAFEAKRREAKTLEDDAKLLLMQCDEAGIDTAAVLTTDNLPLPNARGLRYAARFEQVLAENKALREKFPGRFVTFAGVDPRRGNEAVRLFELAVKEFGCVGYGELVGTLWRTRPDDARQVYPLIEKAIELDVPFISDATMPFGFSDPVIFTNIVRDFPELRLLLGGAGSGVGPVTPRSGGTLPAHEAMLKLAEAHENIWLDLDDWQSKGFESGLGIGSPDSIHLFLDFLKRTLDGPAGGRIMFGTDYPIFVDLFSHKSWIARFIGQAESRDYGFTNAHWERFFSANAMAFLRLA